MPQNKKHCQSLGLSSKEGGAMERQSSSDFSFFQDNVMKSRDDPDSPKPMPASVPDIVRNSSTQTAETLTISQPSDTSIMPPPKPRKKVPFEKGYSQMDWLKLTQTHPDLAGLKGRSCRRLISMEEVRQHKREDDAWTVLRGRVYNISPYLKFHPGGLDMLMKGAGKDCTSLFNKYHAWVNAEFLLEKCLVGGLDNSPSMD